MTNDYDYGDDAGAGFPETKPLTESRAHELRQVASQILAAEYLQSKESNKRKWNKRAKDIKYAKQQLAFVLINEHGFRSYTWVDGLSVRIEHLQPNSGRRWDSTVPPQVIFRR